MDENDDDNNDDDDDDDDGNDDITNVWLQLPENKNGIQNLLQILSNTADSSSVAKNLELLGDISGSTLGLHRKADQHRLTTHSR